MTPGPGRNIPEHHRWTKDFNYAVFIDWPFEDTKTWSRRKANRPLHLRPGTPPDVHRQRIKLSQCSQKWRNLSDEQKQVWKTICARIVRPKHRGKTHEWTVKGRKAFMSSCMLGYIRSCDQIDNPPDVPPGTIFDILMFHFRIVDINFNPINKAKVTIFSKTVKENSTDKVMYSQKTNVDGYSPDFGLAVNFQPYDINVFKVYESQRKTVTITQDTQVDIIMC